MTVIIDAIMFNDEIDFLRLRLDFLRGHVDHFVILESEFTFSGKPKKLLAHEFTKTLRQEYRVSIDVI